MTNNSTQLNENFLHALKTAMLILVSRLNLNATPSKLEAAREQNTKEEWKPIAFADRFLSSTEECQCTNEHELLVIVWSVDCFKYNLYDENCTVTDHRHYFRFYKSRE